MLRPPREATLGASFSLQTQIKGVSRGLSHSRRCRSLCMFRPHSAYGMDYACDFGNNLKGGQNMAVAKIAGSKIKDAAASSDKIALVDFGAAWCGPCKMLEPVLEKVSEEISDQVAFYSVDVDASPMESSSFNIRGVPTMIVFHKGQEIDRMVGFRDKNALISHLKQLAEDKLGS